MLKVRVKKIDELECFHKKEHGDYEYYKRTFVKKDLSQQCAVSYYEIPPQKSAYPYHYHLRNEEVFYIIRGSGLLRTPEGERRVTVGDLIYYPPNEQGAHKLFNDSQEETLAYIEFDTSNPLDIAVYPDSNKVGIFGDNTREFYKRDNQADYYKDE